VTATFIPTGSGAGTSTATGGLFRRQCSRPGCAEVAAATLTYQYARGLVWLDELTAERDPHSYDLCGRHAGRLGVPSGWRLEDRRPIAVPLAS
jgi:hypothetical protein